MRKLKKWKNWPKIGKMEMLSQFPDMTSPSIFFDVVLFLLQPIDNYDAFKVLFAKETPCFL